MKKIILITIAFVLTLLLPTAVVAQDEQGNNSTTTKYFNISVLREGQSALNKSVKYTIYVTPKIDSPETQILWDAPTAIDINPKHKEFVDMYRGETYSFIARVKASKAGTYEISVNLIAWQHDTNYTNSVSDIVTFNEDLLAIPIAPGYTYGQIAKYLIIALLIGGAAWGVIIYSKKGAKIFKRWITPPN
jgi:hypothetical protein